MTPPIWFLVSGLLALFVSHRVRARQQLALRRGLALVGAGTASVAPIRRIGVRASA